MDIDAARCRKLFASVLLAVLDDFNAQFNKELGRRRGNPEGVLHSASRYFRSRDARFLAALAGMEIGPAQVVSAVRLPRDEYKRLTNKDDRHA
ncbi:hypothetical protein KY389_11435 [Paracoccus bogoriensis]|nr:hypothetical protein [Paracoccus bogoriensis]